jgi:hypothetical protein
MTLNALTFSISTREADTLGLAMIAPGARYASVQLAGVKRLIRRHATPVQWRAIEHLIAIGIDTGRMTSGVFHELLAAGDEDKVVSYLYSMIIEAKPLSGVESLDVHLRNQPIELRLRLRQDDD